MRLSGVRQSKWFAYSAGIAGGILFVGLFFIMIGETSTSGFCMVCHEMRWVGEQGWMKSVHYQNDSGVTAGCGDCHIPPSLVPKLWVKARDGAKDVYTHFLGEADIDEMDWGHMSKLARRKIHDASCAKCHHNLTAKGLPLKAIMAHRQYLRYRNKRCLDCHVGQFHKPEEKPLHLTDMSNPGGTP